MPDIDYPAEWVRQSMAQIAAWDGKGKSPLHPCRELAQECMRATTATQNASNDEISVRLHRD